jgi:hypothetical protein
LKETRPLWPPQRGVGLQEPNLGKTNPRVALFICLRFVFHSLSRGLDFISNANPACSCVYICKFQFRPIHPPLGDYQICYLLHAHKIRMSKNVRRKKMNRHAWKQKIVFNWHAWKQKKSYLMLYFLYKYRIAPTAM